MKIGDLTRHVRGMWGAQKPRDDTKSITHDYRQHRRCWGHNFSSWYRDGNRISVLGLGPLGGPRIRKGDRIAVSFDGYDAALEVIKIEYYRDPPDMWKATLSAKNAVLLAPPEFAGELEDLDAQTHEED